MDKIKSLRPVTPLSWRDYLELHGFWYKEMPPSWGHSGDITILIKKRNSTGKWFSGNLIFTSNEIGKNEEYVRLKVLALAQQIRNKIDNSKNIFREILLEKNANT